MSYLAAVVAWVVIIWWTIGTNTRGIRLLWTVGRMMDRLIDNPLTLSIATRGFHGYIFSLLCLLMLAVLLSRSNGNTDNLIITGSGAGSQHSLKLGVETTHKPMLFLDIYTNILRSILR